MTFALASPACAELLISVDKSTQTMTVAEDGDTLYTWPVSTGVARYDTPSGEFKPFRMEKDHFSREWDDAPMPYSIFFTMKGHAIHGTNHKIDGAAHSHGCVRLSVAHAAALWALVRKNKMANTHVVLTGTVPDAAPAVAQRAPVSRAPDMRATAPRYAAPRYAEPRYAEPQDDQADFERGFAPGDEAAAPSAVPRQRIVGWRDANGRIHYYDRPRVYYAPAPRYFRYGDAEPPPRGFFYDRR
ncbi:MAG: L,D-transpeptidase [Pseudolabrys sp.]